MALSKRFCARQLFVPGDDDYELVRTTKCAQFINKNAAGLDLYPEQTFLISNYHKGPLATEPPFYFTVLARFYFNSNVSRESFVGKEMFFNAGPKLQSKYGCSFANTTRVVFQEDTEDVSFDMVCTRLSSMEALLTLPRGMIASGVLSVPMYCGDVSRPTFDLCFMGFERTNASIREPLVCKKGDTVVVSTNMIQWSDYVHHLVSLESMHVYGEVFPRSSTWSKIGPVLVHKGIVDVDYRGPVRVLLYVLNDCTLNIDPYTPIAQLVVHSMPKCR